MTTRTADIDDVRRLVHLMDESFRIPILGRRFGWDAIIGLVPFLGDAVGAAVGSYIVFRAWRLGVPRATVARMVGNVLVDFLIGDIPIIGDLFDFVFKSNRRNLELLERHLATQRAPERSAAPTG